MAKDLEQHYTPAEARALLRIGATTLHEELHVRRTLPYLRIGRSVRIPASALTAWVAARMSARPMDAAAPAPQ